MMSPCSSQVCCTWHHELQKQWCHESPWQSERSTKSSLSVWSIVSSNAGTSLSVSAGSPPSTLSVTHTHTHRVQGSYLWFSSVEALQRTKSQVSDNYQIFSWKQSTDHLVIQINIISTQRQIYIDQLLTHLTTTWLYWSTHMIICVEGWLSKSDLQYLTVWHWMTSLLITRSINRTISQYCDDWWFSSCFCHVKTWAIIIMINNTVDHYVLCLSGLHQISVSNSLL